MNVRLQLVGSDENKKSILKVGCLVHGSDFLEFRGITEFYAEVTLLLTNSAELRILPRNSVL
jgi:hypothetical protein